MKYCLTFAFIISISILRAQELKKSINKDSLLKVLIRNLPAEYKNEVIKEFQSASDQNKGNILFFLSMPSSSKQLQMKNIDSNYLKISKLKNKYKELDPSNDIVSIEFNPADLNFNVKERINMSITTYKNKETVVSQDWNMEYNSDKLNNLIEKVGWNYTTLKLIKRLLFDAGCISIENGEKTTIGFARNGFGMYSYVIFDNDLNTTQVKNYNDGCNFIFYKKNVVLKYEGGAAGPQCFPDNK